MTCLLRLFRQSFPDAVDWIVAGTMASGFRPIHHRADSLTDPARSLGFRKPDLRERFQDFSRADLVDSCIAEMGVGIFFQSTYPLRSMLLVLPRLLMVSVDKFGGLLKSRCMVASPAPLLQWVSAVSGDFSQFGCLLTGLGKRRGRDAPEANVCSPTLHNCTKYPLLAAGVTHNNVQAVTV